MGRLNSANGQTADLLQQLKAVQAENAALMGQLALSQGRDSEAAAAHRTLQEALDGMSRDLSRCVQAMWLGPSLPVRKCMPLSLSLSLCCPASCVVVAVLRC